MLLNIGKEKGKTIDVNRKMISLNFYSTFSGFMQYLIPIRISYRI